MNSPFLRLIEVTKRYEGKPAVNRVSLDVFEGEIAVLLGPSGCGKTTTLRLIAGLETPDEGEVWIASERVASAGRNLVAPRARGIGLVFQDLALWPHFTVAGNLEFVLASTGGLKSERAKRIAEVLRLMKIESFAERYPGQLSGGEQQRAALARALVGYPRLLLLDEPMSSLDADLKRELLQELASVQRSFGITTIYITHDPAEAAVLAHRVISMRAGSIELGTLRPLKDALTEQSSKG